MGILRMKGLAGLWIRIYRMKGLAGVRDEPDGLGFTT
jgi:hypothetical protein